MEIYENGLLVVIESVPQIFSTSQANRFVAAITEHSSVTDSTNTFKCAACPKYVILSSCWWYKTKDIAKAKSFGMINEWGQWHKYWLSSWFFHLLQLVGN